MTDLRDEKPGRKPRRKATTELGRTMLQRERQRLAREQAQLGEALANEARQARAQNVIRAEHKVVRTSPEHIAVSRGILRRVAGVLASEEVYASIETLPRERMSAWTDFSKIHVEYKVHDDVRLLAAVLRGLLYHEGGHIRFTLPWADLRTQAQADYLEQTGVERLPAPAGANDRELHRAWNCLEDQRMETAVVSDSPRKAAYFTPMVMAELLPTVDAAAANYPLLVWRRYLPERVRQGARAKFVVRHGGDGDAEDLTRRIEAVVDTYVRATDALTMYTAVCDMWILLQAIRPLDYKGDFGHSRQGGRGRTSKGYDDFLSIPIDPSMITPGDAEGDDFGDEDEDEDEAFDTLTDPDDFRHFLDILWTLLNGGDVFGVQYVIPSAPQASEDDEDEDEGEGSGPGDLLNEQPKDEGTPEASKDENEDEDDDSADSADSTDEGDEGDEADDNEDDDDQDADDDASDEDAEQDAPGGDSGDHGDDDGSDNDEPLTQDELDEALAEAEAERNSDRALDGDVESYQDALDGHTSDLDVYLGGISQNTEARIQADFLAQEIEQSFHAATMDKAPAWVEQQRRGVVNVSRYATRQPGDNEFFRQWTEDDQPGYDIAVSVLLDYSGSMTSYMGKLAQAGYAAKMACQRLGIPCTVTLWDTDAKTLFDATETISDLPTLKAAGGTDPSVALSDLENQRYDRAKHIVLIMTDGEWDSEWSKGRTLAYYATAGRMMIGFGFGGGYLAEGLCRKGCDEAYNINDLMEIPRHLEDLLIRVA